MKDPVYVIKVCRKQKDFHQNQLKIRNGIQAMQTDLWWLLFQGSDTSAAAISYCFLMLAMHQDIQERVFKEQCDIFSKIDTASTLADINEMKYLEMVIKESLRLCAAPAILREVSKDIDIGICLTNSI